MEAVKTSEVEGFAPRFFNLFDPELPVPGREGNICFESGSDELLQELDLFSYFSVIFEQEPQKDSWS